MSGVFVSPWPVSLPGHGPKRTCPYSPCVECGAAPPTDDVVYIGGRTIPVPAITGTWVAYGDVPLCLHHARARLVAAP